MASRCRPGSSGPTSSRTCSSKGYGAVIQGIYGEDPARAPPPEGLPRRPRDLPRRLLPGQPRQGASPRPTTSSTRSAGRTRATRATGGRRRWSTTSRPRSAAGRIPAMWALPAGRRAARRSTDPTSSRSRERRRARPPPAGARARARRRPRPPVVGARRQRRRPRRPVDTPLDGSPDLGGVVMIPILEICLIDPPPAGCPTGVPATFQFEATPVLQVPPGPTVDVVFVDSDRPNVAIVGFTVDPPGPATVHFWQHDGDARRRSADAVVDVVASRCSGRPSQLANLDVLAATDVRLPGDRGRRDLRRQQPGRPVHDGQRRRAVRRRARRRPPRRRSRSRTGCRPTCTSRRTPTPRRWSSSADLGGGVVRRRALDFGGLGVLRRHRHRRRRPRHVRAGRGDLRAVRHRRRRPSSSARSRPRSARRPRTAT